jgi:hypothetical protein
MIGGLGVVVVAVGSWREGFDRCTLRRLGWVDHGSAATLKIEKKIHSIVERAQKDGKGTGCIFDTGVN